MDKEKINGMLDAAFELEGLLMLAASRESSGDHLDSLILAKAEKILAMAQEGNTHDAPAPLAPSAEAMSINVEVDDDEDDELEAEEHIEEHFYAEPEEAQSETRDLGNIADSTEFEEEEEAEPSVPTVPFPGEMLMPRRPEPKRGKLMAMFTLNDKFRFRKELFSGADNSFNAAVGFIESLDSIDEAEDYIYGDLGMDSDRPEVQEFMAVIEKYFG